MSKLQERYEIPNEQSEPLVERLDAWSAEELNREAARLRKRGEEGLAHADVLEGLGNDDLMKQDVARLRKRSEARFNIAAPRLMATIVEGNVTHDHEHHHVAESVSDTARWIAGMLGLPEPRPAEESLPH